MQNNFHNFQKKILYSCMHCYDAHKIVKIIVKYIVYLAVFEALYLVVGEDDKYVHVVNMSPGNLLQLVVRRLSTNLHI